MFRRIEKAIPMITLLTVGITVVSAVGQIVWGIHTSSLLLCICALFNIGMALAKVYSFKGMRGTSGKKEQLCYYREVGIVILVSGIFFVVCSLWMFIGEKLIQYSLPMAIYATSFSVAEIVLNIRGLVCAGRSKSLFLQANSMIGLASSFICLVLTQTAFRTHAYPVGNPSLENKLSGIFLGFCAALIGLYMIVYSYATQRKKREESYEKVTFKITREKVHEKRIDFIGGSKTN